MNAFQAAFVPSRWRKMGMVFLTMCLMGCVMAFHFGTVRLVLLAAIGISGAWAWRESPHFVQHLDVQDDVAYLTIQNQTVEANLRSGSLISRHVCFLRWQCENRTIWQCVLPDMLPENDFRRLRLWALWCQYR
ncbi:protein YgfX [Alysiella filiformis]|uniref:Toxin CptA n=1 Tax=Alysiella filiformis DSM 16848 TaxID=1120981 RepID=A0A286EAV9_9NEIS|nr:protein YgfX [Alysiella filiformis]QMT32237.1 hypothetical protein H3L97_05235 [Alysiella filiformis]UBQ56843.1 hypothetical protein JF568_03450 [Alysiella filiformis DSM 16848]SOD68075.1 hypothetical protein SAMN02746062_01115 [Alysiella filiformis DSM 16848]